MQIGRCSRIFALLWLPVDWRTSCSQRNRSLFSSSHNLKGTRMPFPFDKHGPGRKLECHGYLLRAAVDLLLTPLLPPAATILSEVNNGASRGTFKLSSCIDEYDRVPCPLYQVPVASASNAYESPLSATEKTKVNQLSRLELSAKLHVPAHLSGGEDSMWCIDALLGPGAIRFNVSGDGAARPQGTWCALPAEGIWRLPNKVLQNNTDEARTMNS
jgi:hypothetical protein